MPAPQVESWKQLRRIALSPKKDDDNYEISDRDDNSEGEIVEIDRSHKHVPSWSQNYLELLEAQGGIDPDSIFGRTVPQCDLERVFADECYARFGTERPRRKRGSSGEWTQDRLSKAEISVYKEKMGQTQPWNTATACADAAARRHLPPSASAPALAPALGGS